NWRCQRHGGGALFGAASGTFKTGTYSRFLPGRMQASYKRHLSEQSLSLRSEAALVHARITDLLQRVDAGESGQLWQELRALGRQLIAARDTRNYASVGTTITALLAVIEQGARARRVARDHYVVDEESGPPQDRARHDGRCPTADAAGHG